MVHRDRVAWSPEVLRKFKIEFDFKFPLYNKTSFPKVQKSPSAYEYCRIS